MALTFEQYKKLRRQGLSEEQIVAFDRGYKPPKPKFDVMANLVRPTVENLDIIGSTAGGVALSETGPGAVAGMFLGGMAGKALQQGLNPLVGIQNPKSPAEMALQVGGTGATQAVFGAASETAPLAAKAVSTALSRFALRGTKAVKRFPRLPENVAEAGKAVGGLGPMGKKAAAEESALAAQTVEGIVGQATQAGHKISARELAEPSINAARSSGAKLIPRDEQALVMRTRQMANEYLARAQGVEDAKLYNFTTFTPEQVQLIKQEVANDLDSYFAQRAAGKIMRSKKTLARFHQGTLGSLEKLPDFGPAIAAANKASQTALGIKRGLIQAGERPERLVGALSFGAGAGAGEYLTRNPVEALLLGVLARGITSRTSASHLAAVLANPAVQDVLKVRPQLLQYLYRQANQSSNP